ncbi:unnamed protein product [Enterobius vermicularis]|uniref:Transmembrane protein n=1 Tax=Enterobius vermicularis TaxID=51028 RepID=A0A0N4UW25_ENTVE|nr:unnamed protein product [Enterobius vermicularis]
MKGTILHGVVNVYFSWSIILYCMDLVISYPSFEAYAPPVVEYIFLGLGDVVINCDVIVQQVTIPKVPNLRGEGYLQSKKIGIKDSDKEKGIAAAYEGWT